jgi:hypothetical protein
MHENVELKDRTQHLEHVILQLQSETETIGKRKSLSFDYLFSIFVLKLGDYIYLYQQQREQLQRRYQEKDDYIKQLTQDRFYLQVKFLFLFYKKNKKNLCFLYLEKIIGIRNFTYSKFE